ncbi:unnamed protein product [Phytomonas sp. EM1]|nr:unnamed protein product [Phytomonas sp. EM1]|eukprot:CCW64139.1 unnamed protein product [Phytomonas sp. isolate EM1]
MISVALKNLEDSIEQYLDEIKRTGKGDLQQVILSSCIFQSELHELTRCLHERNIHIEHERRSGNLKYI